MNEKKENNNALNIEETKNQKCINPNLINKKLFNKNSILEQKRLFQMQKRLTLLNEEELSEIELNINNEKNEIVNLNSFQQFQQNRKQINRIKQNKNSLSFNCISNHKDLLSKDNIIKKEKDITFINLGNINEENNEIKNEQNKKLKNEVESRNNKDVNKEEELSIKKKNTNSNTNDEDKSSSEVILFNEFEQIRKKTINQNDSIEQIAFTNIINEDIDENTDIVSKKNTNNNINEENKDVINENLNSKDYETENINKNENIQENFMNNFDFFNIINDANDIINKKENNNSPEIKDNKFEEEQNNSVIINEDYNDNNNINENNDNNNEEEEENVELNISNLEIDIDQINNDNNYVQNEDELVMSGSNSNEFAKKYLSSKSKSFIKFNNNLTARVAAHSLKNSPSYMLALCPELLEGLNKKNIIRDNYAVTDAISEEMESDTFTPRQSEKIDYSINKNTIDYNQSINTNEYQINNSLRNKEIKNSLNIEFLLKNKEQITPKCFNKNKNKINKNRIKEIKDINIELKDFSNCKNKKINKKSYSTSINPLNNIFNTKNNNYNNNNSNKKNGILKHSEKKNLPINDNLKIKIKHQKAKSLVNNTQINSSILNGNTNNHNKNSPKQVSFKLFDKTNNNTKRLLKNSKYKKLLFNKEKSEKNNDLKNKQKKYLSNDIYTNNNSQNNYKKANSKEIMINNLKLCKSEKRTKQIASKMNNSYSQKNNVQFLSKSNPYKHNKINNNEKKKNICYTEKANKSKNYITFISHMKKNTPVNINNITEQNINHSKKLSQQICDGYYYFMNSLNNHNNNNCNNYLKEINKINLGLNNFNNMKSTPLSNYFSFNKDKLINNKNNNNCNNNNNLTFIKKNSLHKDDKKPFPISIHNKSKTAFISPSYLNLNKNKLFTKNLALNNNKNTNKKMNNEKINNNIKKFITKNNNKFNEIKKIVNDSTVKIIHKKINTIGNSNDLTKLLNKNVNNGLYRKLKGSSSNNNLRKNFNKHKIIMALQHIKFVPNENYSKVLNELYKSKKNLFIILVYTDSTQRYIFRGLYEVNSTDQKTANKLFAPGFSQNIINIISLNSFFNYQSNNGEFVKIKFKDDNDKKFNSDTIIVY